MCFAVGMLLYERPLLGPLYQWLAAVQDRREAVLPWAIQFFLSWLAKRLRGEGRLRQVSPPLASLGGAFRADARAGEGMAAVGGWECLGGTPASEARWFAVEVTPAWAPRPS